MKKFFAVALLWLLVTPTFGQSNIPLNHVPLGRGAGVSTFHDGGVTPVINVTDATYGAKCDDSTDDTAAITAAITAMPSTGSILVFPGICRFTSLTFNKPGRYMGQGKGRQTTGTAPTELKTTTAGGGIIVTANGVDVRDVLLTSTIAAGSRTAAGLKLTSAQNLRLQNVTSNGHLYGFWIQQGVVDFINTYAISNASHGYYMDGDLGAGLGEFWFSNAGASSNGGNGFYFFGLNTGTFMSRPVTASNTGAGIRFTSSAAGATQDMYISLAEVSTNTGNGVDISTCTNCVNFSIVGGLIEGAGTYGVAVGTSTVQVNILGLHIDGFGTGLFLDGQGGTIAGNVFSGSTTTEIELGTNSSNYSFGANTDTIVMGTAPVGLKVTGSAAKFSAAGLNLSHATSALSGTIPTGSQIVASPGLSNRIQTSLTIDGSSSGTLIVKPPAAAGSNTLTFPAGTTDFSGTGGTSQVIKQTSSGGAFTVAQLACADLSNATSACSTTPAALTKTDDTNVTLTLGGTPTTALLQATSLTLGWTGQLSVARGGTGIASGTSGGIPYFSSTTTIASSALLAANVIVVGGGAATAPLTQPTTPPTVSSAGILNIVNATDSVASTVTGAEIIAGGLAVVKSATIGNNLNIGGTTLGAAGTHNIEVFSGTTVGNTAIMIFGQSSTRALDIAWNYSATTPVATINTINYTDPIQIDASVLYLNAASGGVLNVGTAATVSTFAGTTDASSSTVGADVFSGGVAIAKKLFVGTSATTPIIYGGTGAASSLTLTATSGVGAGSEFVDIMGGSNGAFRLARFTNTINGTAAGLSIGTTSAAVNGINFAGDTGTDANFGVVRATGTNAGTKMSFVAGGGASGASNKNGGNVEFTSGISTGSGTSSIKFTAYPGTAAATSDNTTAVGMVLTATSSSASLLTITGTITISALANVATTSAVCWNTGTGAVTYDGTLGTCTVSDERLKDMGPRIDGALERLLKIDGVYYTWKDQTIPTGRQIGVGAQTVERVFPELVQTDSEGKKSADYPRLTAPIIEGMRELDARLRVLEARP